MSDGFWQRYDESSLSFLPKGMIHEPRLWVINMVMLVRLLPQNFPMTWVFQRHDESSIAHRSQYPVSKCWSKHLASLFLHARDGRPAPTQLYRPRVIGKVQTSGDDSCAARVVSGVCVRVCVWNRPDSFLGLLLLLLCCLFALSQP